MKLHTYYLNNLGRKKREASLNSTTAESGGATFNVTIVADTSIATEAAAGVTSESATNVITESATNVIPEAAAGVTSESATSVTTESATSVTTESATSVTAESATSVTPSVDLTTERVVRCVSWMSGTAAYWSYGYEIPESCFSKFILLSHAKYVCYHSMVVNYILTS